MWSNQTQTTDLLTRGRPAQTLVQQLLQKTQKWVLTALLLASSDGEMITRETQEVQEGACSTEPARVSYLVFLSAPILPPSTSVSLSSVGLWGSERGNAVFRVSTMAFTTICTSKHVWAVLIPFIQVYLSSAKSQQQLPRGITSCETRAGHFFHISAPSQQTKHKHSLVLEWNIHLVYAWHNERFLDKGDPGICIESEEFLHLLTVGYFRDGAQLLKRLKQKEATRNVAAGQQTTRVHYRKVFHQLLERSPGGPSWLLSYHCPCFQTACLEIFSLDLSRLEKDQMSQTGTNKLSKVLKGLMQHSFQMSRKI